ncbi:hypothetical protein CDAR_26201 [Caerostris darwini]|uniref:Uncharacterized protein n=1 Tax=Caerostris darwini TaxID=1538125 RepID=A0AAV4NBJ2_9ARAC|nr:hypothetical protein CDAR_26201 [Caerostris darwini]
MIVFNGARDNLSHPKRRVLNFRFLCVLRPNNRVIFCGPAKRHQLRNRRRLLYKVCGGGGRWALLFKCRFCSDESVFQELLTWSRGEEDELTLFSSSMELF